MLVRQPKLVNPFGDLFKYVKSLNRLSQPFIKVSDSVKKFSSFYEEVKKEFMNEFPNEPIEIDGEFNKKFIDWFKKYKKTED